MAIKGVIIAGGLGTRLRPLTKTINKQLLPVYNQPLIYYPLQILINAGIKEIMIISAVGHAGQLLEHFGDNEEYADIRFEYAIQKDPVGGIAQALGMAHEFVGDDKVAAILGDNIFEDNVFEAVQDFDQNQEEGGKVFIKEVNDPHRFGVPEIKDGKIVSIEEKPQNPKSNYCVTGLYLYDNRVWEIIKNLKPSERGQLEITDVNNFYVQEGSMTYEEIKGRWIDAGTFDSLLEANIWAAQKQGVDISQFEL